MVERVVLGLANLKSVPLELVLVAQLVPRAVYSIHAAPQAHSASRAQVAPKLCSAFLDNYPKGP